MKDSLALIPLELGEKTIGQIMASIIREKPKRKKMKKTSKTSIEKYPKLKNAPLILKMRENQEIINPLINSLKPMLQELI